MGTRRTVTVYLKDGSTKRYSASEGLYHYGDVRVYEEELTGDITIEWEHSRKANLLCPWKTEEKVERIKGNLVDRVEVQDWGKPRFPWGERETKRRVIVPSGWKKRLA